MVKLFSGSILSAALVLAQLSTAHLTAHPDVHAIEARKIKTTTETGTVLTTVTVTKTKTDKSGHVKTITAVKVNPNPSSSSQDMQEKRNKNRMPRRDFQNPHAPREGGVLRAPHH